MKFSQAWLTPKLLLPVRAQGMLRKWKRRLQELRLPYRQSFQPKGEGINVIGSIKAEVGLGEWTRSTLRAAMSANISVHVVDRNVFENVRLDEEIDHRSTHSELFDINLFHFNPNHLYRSIGMLSSYFKQRYNIGCWIWEVDGWPQEWAAAFSPFNEIWTPSTFSQRVIQRQTDLPVTYVPISVAPEVLANVSRESLGLPRDGLLFLTMADFFSCPERKNPLGVLEAFTRAFGSRPSGVYLVLKLNNAFQRTDVMRTVQQYLDRNSSIIPLYGYLDRSVLNSLIAQADCLVSLHRAEGFGLPIAEAMFLGKPVIATGWSGNMDFMDASNSLPVDYELVEIQDDIPNTLYKRGNRWAEPNLDLAADLMKLIESNFEFGRKVGRKAANDIRAAFSSERIGLLMRDRLRAIAEGRV
jgi:glycosyltransferase involved in cell wall biosynthesis